MVTQGQQCLVDELSYFLKKRNKRRTPNRILNIGSGINLSIENELVGSRHFFVCDRIDIEDYEVEHPFVEKCLNCSVEEMPQMKSKGYVSAFANYVLEHIPNIRKASKEIFRVLKPGGVFVASVPNVSAPEFQIAKVTPLWFHKLIRQGDAWETHYSYESIEDLKKQFQAAGFSTVKIEYFSAVGGYLRKFPVLSILGRMYDKIIEKLGNKDLLGDVCITFRKPDNLKK